MVIDSRLTAAQFGAQKLDLPEGGRWHELHDGKTVLMDPPDDDHGNVVLNISRALADWFQDSPDVTTGYACHEIGLCVASDPDTVYCPAISFFNTGQQFAESDSNVANSVPALVVDIASANDRRREMRRRTLGYVELGVKVVWVPDPMKKEVQIIQSGRHTEALAGRQTVTAGEILPGFEITVSDVFRQPKWWK